MLSYAHGASAEPLLGETIGHNLERTVARVPDADALVDATHARRYTYAEFGDAVDRLAGGMLAGGLSKGDRVGVWSPNRAEWALVQFATAKLGLILVNINPSYRISELRYALGQSGCRWLVSAQASKNSDFAAMVEEVGGDLPDLERAIFFGTPDWEELAAGPARPDELRALMAGLDIDDPINIQYTSGTTGFPKGATLSHHNILNNAHFVAANLRYDERDRVCIPVPLYHCFGMVMGNLSCATRGACMVYPAESFEPGATLRACAQERCTSLYGVPTMFIAMLSEPDFATFDLGALRTGIMAGSPCPVEVMKRVNGDMGIEQISIAFGKTETSPVSTFVPVEDTLEHAVRPSVRRCHTPRSRSSTPTPVAPSRAASPGSSAPAGIWSCAATGTSPSAPRRRSTPRGWMQSGDLATMDEDGYVRIVGRIKDMVIRGGENLYPREIEEFLYTHPEIADVQVIGVPDERYGEELMAWVILRARRDFDGRGRCGTSAAARSPT